MRESFLELDEALVNESLESGSAGPLGSEGLLRAMPFSGAFMTTLGTGPPGQGLLAEADLASLQVATFDGQSDPSQIFNEMDGQMKGLFDKLEDRQIEYFKANMKIHPTMERSVKDPQQFIGDLERTFGSQYRTRLTGIPPSTMTRDAAASLFEFIPAAIDGAIQVGHSQTSDAKEGHSRSGKRK